MGRRVSAILWGPNFENVLNFGYPLFNVITDREPRPGSDFVQATSGIEDAWLTGYDYTLDVEARFLPLQPNFYGSQSPNTLQSPIAGAGSVQGFLDWARQKNTFRFVPDIAVPSFYVDSCYLAEPTAGGRSITPSLDFAQKVKLRNASVDFLQAMRGLFYEYEPGQSLTDPLAHTYTRANIAYQISRDGYLQQLPSGVLCDGHYVNGLQTTLVENALATVDITNQEAIDNPSWFRNQILAVTANVAKAPDGNLTADLVVENTAVLTGSDSHYIQSNSTPIALGDVLTGLIYVRSGGRYRGRVYFQGNGTFNAAGVIYDLHAQTLTATNFGTTGVVLASKLTPLANGWFMIWWRAKVDPAATSSVMTCQLTDGNGNATYTGDGVSGTYFWGATAVHGATNVVASYTPASSAADVLSAPFTAPPQAAWLYVRFVELGGKYIPAANYESILTVGNWSAPNWRWTLYLDSVPNAYVTNGNSTNAVSSSVAADWNVGDVIELLGLVFADGSVKVIKCVNGGSEVASAQSAALAMPADFITRTVWVGNDNSGQQRAQAIARVKIGPLVPFAGVTMNSIALARSA